MKKHVDRLVELTEAESLETKNIEEAVNEFDERLAGARAKAVLISKVVGEEDGTVGGQTTTTDSALDGEGKEVEVALGGNARRRDDRVKKTGEMEDFVSLPNVRKTG